jgi:serine/threonine-protein kinase
MGSPAFMSPEQARGRWDLVGPQSDLWSVGATMFTLLAGRDVHLEETVPELLAAIFTKPVPSLATLIPDCDPRVAAIVDRALQVSLCNRWPDARSMQAAVREAASALGAPRDDAPAPFALVPTNAGAAEGARPHPAGRDATTVVPLGSDRAARIGRRAALAGAAALAAALGAAGLAWTVRPPSLPPLPSLPSLARAEALELAEAPALPLPAPLSQQPQPRPPATETPAPPTNRRPSATPASAPSVRAQRRSIYDRRL